VDVGNDVGWNGGQRIPITTHWIGDGGFRSSKTNGDLDKGF